MNSVSVLAVEAEKTTRIFTAEQTVKMKPLVICGACGAEEKVMDDNTTECPYCDEYIY